MDDDGHRARLQIQKLRSLLIVDLGHVSDLQKVVARSECAQLIDAALPGTVSHGVGACSIDPPVLLDELKVGSRAIAAIDGPPSTPRRDVTEFFLRNGKRAGCPDAGGDAPV